MDSLSSQIAKELNVEAQQVTAAINLLDDGATVPFISRYRKEATGGLDDSQMRTLESRLNYLREFNDRRETILRSIADQGKLTPALELSIKQAETKNQLEDLYLPYKPKRRTKGEIARQAGLEPLAMALLHDPSLVPEESAAQFIDPQKGIEDEKQALDGAKFILMEYFSEDASLVESLRRFLWSNGRLTVNVVAGKEKTGVKFSDYFAHEEPLRNIPSHRALAIFRGRSEGFLEFHIALDGDDTDHGHPCEAVIRKHFMLSDNGRPADKWLLECVRWTWRVKLLSRLETDIFSEIKDNSEAEAIAVFAKNLRDILLAAPAGPRATIGLDPGLRTGVKVAVLNNTGQIVDHTAIYPHAPQNQWQPAIETLAKLCKQYQIELISIGNGTASRETDKLVGELMKAYPELALQKIIVNEAGASIYSASAFAAQELPTLDVTIRGAVSIARRLQDPLAELVKIEPKSIGVGQYQHDVNQTQLARQLDTVVEDCVNAVGVDINTASPPLLSRVSGLNTAIANNLVEFRDNNGTFTNRNQLKQVARLGNKAFEQSAGFLRINQGDNPLDQSSVHPESYPLVAKIAKQNRCEVEDIIGNNQLLRQLNAADFVDQQFGLPTVIDVIAELEKPGRDPRPAFKTAELKDGVNTLADLKLDMILEGTVTNVTNFGAFVDIGVHQDGLVHISALSSKFVKDPHQVVKAGDIVKVKVMTVDIERKRIGLTMRLQDQAADHSANATTHGKPERNRSSKPAADRAKNKINNRSSNKNHGTFATLFAEAQQRKNGKR